MPPQYSCAPCLVRQANALGPLVGAAHLAAIVGAWLLLLPLAPIYVGAAWATSALKRRGTQKA